MRSIALVGSAAFLMLPCALFAAGPVADVNGEAIPRTEFDKNWDALLTQEKKMLKPEAMTDDWKHKAKDQLLDQMIDRRLMLQEAKKRGLKVSKSDLDAAINQIKQRFQVDIEGKPLGPAEAEEAFKKELDKEGLSQAQFEENTRNELLAQFLMRRTLQNETRAPSEEDIRKLYDSVMARMAKSGDQPEDAKQPGIVALARQFELASKEQVRFQHIFFPVASGASRADTDAALKKAKDAKSQLDKGAKFGDLARKLSEDKSTAARGGDVGYVYRGQLEDLGKTIFSLPVGEISEPVKSRIGYHVIRIEERKAGSELTYDDVRQFLANALVRAQEQEESARFIAGLRKAASIQVHL